MLGVVGRAHELVVFLFTVFFSRQYFRPRKCTSRSRERAESTMKVMLCSSSKHRYT